MRTDRPQSWLSDIGGVLVREEHARPGIEAGLDTLLVLIGSTRPGDVHRVPDRPSRVLDSIADVVEKV